MTRRRLIFLFLFEISGVGILTLGRGRYILIVMNLTEVMTKLKQCLPTFHKENLKNKQQNHNTEEITKERDFAFLRNYISIIFPSDVCKDLNIDEIILAQDENDYLIANIDVLKKSNKNKLTNDYLPFHIHDDKWLANYISALLKESKQQKLISIEQILDFVETDKEFNLARQAYEVDLTRAQIKYMMEANKPNELLKYNVYDPQKNKYIRKSFYCPGLSRFHKDPDKLFRQSVIAAMKNLKLDSLSIEIGLEKHASLWRKDLMKDAFYNHYAKSAQEEKFIRLEGWYLEAEKQNFQEKWLKLREYEYGQEHQAIIQQLGCATPNMKLSQKELQNLRQEVNEIDQEFQALALMSDKTPQKQQSIEK